MRTILSQDIGAAARALMPVPPEKRRAMIRQLLQEADEADQYRRRSGRAHPSFGDGTLIAAALAHPVAPEPPCEDADFQACLVLVLTALLAEKGRLSRVA